MFHQPVRFFPAVKFATSRNSIDTRVSHWRYAPRLNRKNQKKDSGGSIQQDGFTVIDDYTGHESKEHKRNASEPRTSRSSGGSCNGAPDYGERLSRSTSTLNDRKRSPMVASPNHSNRDTPRGISGKPEDSVTRVASRHLPLGMVGTFVGLGDRDRLIATMQRPDLNVRGNGPDNIVASPMHSSGELSVTGSPGKITTHKFRRYNLDGPSTKRNMREEISIRESRPMSDVRAKQTEEYAHSNLRRSPPALYSASRINRFADPLDTEPSGSKKTIHGSLASTQSTIDDDPEDLSSYEVGELWLDTLALREWLQGYLSDETGRASRARNGAAGSLTDV